MFCTRLIQQIIGIVMATYSVEDVHHLG